MVEPQSRGGPGAWLRRALRLGERSERPTSIRVTEAPQKEGSPSMSSEKPGSVMFRAPPHGKADGQSVKTKGDNASVMTIASSSKRTRRSFDTNASTRALAAESLFSVDTEN